LGASINSAKLAICARSQPNLRTVPVHFKHWPELKSLGYPLVKISWS